MGNIRGYSRELYAAASMELSCLLLFHRVFLTLFRDSTGAVSRFSRSLPHSGAEDGKREAGGSASPAGLSTVLGLR